MNWTNEENFVEALRQLVIQQYADVVLTEPQAHLFLWRRGKNIVQMLMHSETRVSLNFVGSETPRPEQLFPADMSAIQEIANAIVEWLNFQRYRERGM